MLLARNTREDSDRHSEPWAEPLKKGEHMNWNQIEGKWKQFAGSRALG